MSGGENVFLTITQNQEAIILKGLLSSTNFFPKSICMENKQTKTKSKTNDTGKKYLQFISKRESERRDHKNPQIRSTS